MGALNRSVVAPLSSAIITVMLAGLVVAGVDSLNQNKVKAGTARLEPNGIVEVSIGGAPFVRASHGRTLGASDAVRVIDGRAVLDLPNSSKVELRAGTALTVNGATSPPIALDEGDLLVETGRGDTVAIDGGTSLISVAGSAKLRRGVSLAAGVYEGTARLQRNDQGLTIPQYRQAAVVGTGILPQSPEPLGLAPSDEWDRRMLGSVMALDEQLGIIARTFEAAAPLSPGADFFKGVAPKVASLPITAELLDGRAAGENLIGLTLVSLDKGDFLNRFQRIFGFRAQGASWGLVAADRSINPNPVIDDLEVALANASPNGATDGEEALPGTGSKPGRGPGRTVNLGGVGAIPGLGGNGTGGSSGDGTGGSGGSGTGGSGGSGGTGGGSNPGGGGNPGGGSTPPRKLIDVPQTGTFLDPLLDPLVNPVEDLLSGLLGGLLGQGAPGTSGTGTTSPLSPVTSPTGTTPSTVPPSSPTSGSTGSGTTGSGSTGATAASGGTGATTTGSGSTSTPPPPPPPPSSTTTTTRPGLLGGLVGGLGKTLGGLL